MPIDRGTAPHLRSLRAARAVAVCLPLAFSAAMRAAPAEGSLLRGKALYDGTAPLAARIAGHADALPPQAAVCAHCHVSPGQAAADAPRFAAASILAGALGERRSRRNGPPGAYDASRFCRALRQGIDPVEVQLPSRMPRYALNDDDCDALWRYVSAPGGAR